MFLCLNMPVSLFLCLTLPVFLSLRLAMPVLVLALEILLEDTRCLVFSMVFSGTLTARALLSDLDPHIFYENETLCVCYNYKHKYDV